MKPVPRLSSFTIIGVILIFIAVYGILHGPSFQYDLGVVSDSHEAVYYIVVGVLMIANSFYALPPSPEDLKDKAGNSTKAASVGKK
jgi:hypothetical protein